MTAFADTLGRPGAVPEFEAALAEIPQVIEAQRLFGEPDYLIRVVSPRPFPGRPPRDPSAQRPAP
jgi:hypothetical protein